MGECKSRALWVGAFGSHPAHFPNAFGSIHDLLCRMVIKASALSCKLMKGFRSQFYITFASVNYQL